jgi:predicted outer membrane repeat protein
LYEILTNVVCGSVINLAELGGAVAAAGSLDISNCNFKNNKASASGGAVSATSISTTSSSKGAAAAPLAKQSIANTTFSSNSAIESGGALVRQGLKGTTVQRESVKNAMVLTQVHL